MAPSLRKTVPFHPAIPEQARPETPARHVAPGDEDVDAVEEWLGIGEPLHLLDAVAGEEEHREARLAADATEQWQHCPPLLERLATSERHALDGVAQRRQTRDFK